MLQITTFTFMYEILKCSTNIVNDVLPNILLGVWNT